MKKILFALLMLASMISQSQTPIPNPSLDSWSNGNPTSWSTSNITGLAMGVTQSNDAHSGSAAAKLEPLNALGIVVPPGLNSASDFSINVDYTAFSFYYKCSLSSKDQFIAMGTLKFNSTTKAGAQGILTMSNNTTVYTQTTVLFNYISAGANKASLNFAMSPTASNTLQVGSFVLIDDLAMLSSLPTQINDLSLEPTFKIGAAIPNPAKGISLIPFSLPQNSNVEISLFTIEGKKVMEILNKDLNKGRYKAEFDANLLPSGIYICKLKACEQSAYSKIIIE